MAEHAQVTQTTHPWRTVIRTVFELLVALAFAAPLIWTAATQQSAEAATGAGAVLLAVAGAITRVMSLPAVEQMLRRFVPWLAAAPTEKL